MMRINKILRKNKGFTLVETIVVIAIMAILASGVTFGVIQYQKHAEFKKNNEYAQMLFLAAQSQLTYYKSSGELEDFAKENKGAAKVSAEIATFAKDKDKQLVHLDLETGLADDQLKESAVYKLTKDYISDKAIYSGAIRIELDLASGTVFSACYSTKGKSFVETDGAATTEKISVSVRMRENESLRQEVMLGYYDTDIHLRKLKEVEDDGDIGDIDKENSGLVNDETLKIVLDFKNASPAVIGNGVYKVELYKGAGNGNGKGNKISEFIINDGSVNNTLPTTYVSKQVQTEVAYEKNKGGKAESQECIFETYITSDGKLGIILDAMDISAVRKLNETTGTSAALDKATYKDTYSGMRLGIFGEELIQAKITVSTKSGTVVVDPFVTNKEAPFFKWDGNDNQGNRKEREIAYPRHLYNIRFTEENNERVPYVLKSDIVFGKEETGINSPAVFDNDAKNNLLKEEAYFPAIPVLKSGSKLVGGSKVENATVETNTYKLAKFVVKPNTDDAKQTSLGVIVKNQGTLENIAIEDFTLKAEKEFVLNGVGALVGTNSGTIDNAYVKDAKIIAESSTNVGGFIGVNTTAGSFKMNTYGKGGDNRDGLKPLIYRNLSANIEVSGKENVGGLFGLNQAVTSHSQWNQYFSIDKVSVKGEKSIGGLIGRNEAKVGDFMVFNAEVEATGDYAGGAIGYNAANYALETGPTDTEVYPFVNALEGYKVSGASYVGGIAGINVKNSQIDYYCATKQTVTGTGDFIGGIVGDNAGEIRIVDGATELRGQVSDATISSGGNCVGGLVGRNSGKVLGYQVYNSKVSGNNHVGGAIGENNGEYQFSSNRRLVIDKVTVTGASNVGGIVGKNTKTLKHVNVSNSTVTGTITVGGAIGHNTGTYTFESNTLGLVDKVIVAGSGNMVGGIIGNNEGSKAILQNVYVKETKVTGADYVGGLAGQNSGAVEYTLSGELSPETTAISGRNHVGGLVGRNSGSGKVSGYSFKDLTITASGAAGGACGTLESNATVANVKVANVTFVGATNNSPNGGLIGSNNANLNLNQGNQVTGTITFSPEAVSGVVVGRNSGIISGGTDNMVTGISANFALTEEVRRQDSYRGGIAGDNSGIIRGVTYSGTINSSYGTRHGGIAGRNKGTIDKCYMDGNIQISKAVASVSLGGIAGDNSGTISNSGYKGNKEIVIGQADGASLSGAVGGIVGINQDGGTIINVATTDKKVTLRIDTGNLGGIVGNNKNATVENCHTGKEVSLQLNRSGNLGGIAGIIYSSGTIKDCSNKATVDGTSATISGGIVGYYEARTSNTDSVLLENCVNFGSIAENSNKAGGIIGVISNKTEDIVTINKCRNYVRVISDGTTDGSGLVYGVTESSRVNLTNNFSFLTSTAPFLVSKSGTTDVDELITASGNYYFDSKAEDQRVGDNVTLGGRLITNGGNDLYVDEEENPQKLLSVGWLGSNLNKFEDWQITNIEKAIANYYQTVQ